jgi:hypothetical protein
VIPDLAFVYEELQQRALQPSFEQAYTELREAFEDRTGTFPVDHGKAGERAAAAWEHVLIADRLAIGLSQEMSDPGERELTETMCKAQLGLYELCAHGGHRYVHDGWRGASFLLMPRDDMHRNAMALPEANGVFLGRVLALPEGCTVLPGAIWLPGDAVPLLPNLVAQAQQREMSLQNFSYALLRMDHAFATLSRVKAAFAFRPEALDLQPTSGKTPRSLPRVVLRR